MAIAQVAIGNTDTILLTVPASTSYAITTIMVVNLTVTMLLVLMTVPLICIL